MRSSCCAPLTTGSTRAGSRSTRCSSLVGGPCSAVRDPVCFCQRRATTLDLSRMRFCSVPHSVLALPGVSAAEQGWPLQSPELQVWRQRLRCQHLQQERKQGGVNLSHQLQRVQSCAGKQAEHDWRLIRLWAFGDLRLACSACLAFGLVSGVGLRADGPHL